MADKRETYAGDLTSDVLGKRIRVRTMKGEPYVDGVQHFTERGKRKTTVWFANGASTVLADTDVVEVLPDAVVTALPSGAWTCAVCSAAFNSMGALSRHRTVHVPEGGDVA